MKKKDEIKPNLADLIYIVGGNSVGFAVMLLNLDEGPEKAMWYGLLATLATCAVLLLGLLACGWLPSIFVRIHNKIDEIEKSCKGRQKGEGEDGKS